MLSAGFLFRKLPKIIPVPLPKNGLYQCILELFVFIANVLQVACITHSEISDRKIKEIEKIHNTKEEK